MASPGKQRREVDATVASLVGDEEVDTASFVRDTLARDTSAAVLASLQSKTSELAGTLGTELATKRETLLANVHEVHALETKLLRSTERVEALAQSVQRARAQCSRPFESLRGAVQQQECLVESTELLRQTQRALHLCRRLRECGVGNAGDAPPTAPASASGTPGGTPSTVGLPGATPRSDLAKAAAIYHELEELLAEVDLTGIDLIDAERAGLQRSLREIVDKGEAALWQAVREQSQAQTGSALQVRARAPPHPGDLMMSW